MSDNSDQTDIKSKNYSIGLGTSFGIVIGSVVGANTGNVGFWVAMGICFGAAIGSCISLFTSRQKSDEE